MNGLNQRFLAPREEIPPPPSEPTPGAPIGVPPPERAPQITPPPDSPVRDEPPEEIPVPEPDEADRPGSSEGRPAKDH